MFVMKKPKQEKSKFVKLSNTEGKVKKFSKKLCDKYDIEARELVKYILKDNIKDNPNIYGEDMIFTQDKFPFKYLELQVCSSWDGKIFPYLFPFIYSRKMKFSDNTLIIIFNRLLTEIIMFNKKDVQKVPSRLKKYDRELIHYVGWGCTVRMNTCDLSIDKILLCFNNR